MTKWRKFKDCRTCKYFSYHLDILGCVLGHKEVLNEECKYYEYSKYSENRYIDLRMFLLDLFKPKNEKFFKDKNKDK